jgi:hypothetical protein
MNNPEHISENLQTIFWVKIFKFFNANPGSGMEIIRIREKHQGSATIVAGYVEALFDYGVHRVPFYLYTRTPFQPPTPFKLVARGRISKPWYLIEKQKKAPQNKAR